jgi:AraC family transcriptional regulator of adaptative response/methylated-DNA-[protein]-cysteine methyltransferase
MNQLDPRWQAMTARDRRADGSFVYSVRTTGVYCRPSCPARLARPENVAFHASPEEAEKAGFRPCKRCRPDQPAPAQIQTARIAAACRQIESAEELPSLAALAAAAGLSPFHFHRLFKAITGTTPKKYAQAWRGRRLREELRRGGSVTTALYDAGFNSSAPFYDSAAHMLGMTPGQFRAGGQDKVIRFALTERRLGRLLVACSDIGVCAIALGDDEEQLRRELARDFPRASLIAGDSDFAGTVGKVVALIERPANGFDLPLDIRGTAFQQRVWQALRDIPPGRTASYGAIAARIGAPKAARAVARACAANRLAVAIPCHRVRRDDGSLSGYRWGVERKRRLLESEGEG